MDPKLEIEKDATLDYNRFFCRDFIISTTNSSIGYVTNSGMKVQVRTLYWATNILTS